MIADIGYYSLLAALVLTGFGIFAGLSGIRKNSSNLIFSFRQSILAVFGLVFVAYFSLSWSFINNDFTLKFVAHNSSTDLPLFYKLTAVWGGLEGSLLLWQIILITYTLIISIKYKNSNRDTLPYTLMVLQVTTFFLLFMLIGWSNPFEHIFPIPGEGRGLNPLLQNPGMIFHPPSLYLGYVGFNIPFAFAMGSLLSGTKNDDWIMTTRRWTLIAWFFLTIGMILGGHWAYVELGWGGYWAWDPVENASFMPWLTGTAFLHSVMVQEKRNTMKMWNMMLLIGTFALSILGTFITRSGVLNSVHSFSKSNIGPAFLFYIVVILVFSYVVLYIKQKDLVVKDKPKGLWTKENGFMLNNAVFVAMCFTVFYGTIFPLLSEGLADKKISIQAPFFNDIMLPLAVLLIFLMGITQVLGWKKTSMAKLRKNLIAPVSITGVWVVIAAVTLSTNPKVLFLSGVTVFAFYINLSELISSFRSRAKSSPGKAVKFLGLFKDRRKRGGTLIHMGVLFMMIGFTGSFFGSEASFTLYRGQHHAFAGYDLKYNGSLEFPVDNTTHKAAEILVFKDHKQVARLEPAKSYYPTRPEPLTEVAIYQTLFHDLYLSLASINKDGSATLNVFYNPMVNFVWASVMFFFVGMAYSLSHKPVQKRKDKLKE